MKNIIFVIFIFLVTKISGQDSTLVVSNTITFEVVHSSYWKNGNYSYFRKAIIRVTDSNVIFPHNGNELTEKNFEYLIGLFKTELAWEANVILYAIFKKDAMAIFVSDLTEEIWTDVFKDNEFRYWQTLFNSKNWGNYVDD